MGRMQLMTLHAVHGLGYSGKEAEPVKATQGEDGLHSLV